VTYTFSSYIFKVLLELGMNYNLSFISMFILSFIIIILISYLMYKYVDAFAINTSKNIYNIIQKHILDRKLKELKDNRNLNS